MSKIDIKIKTCQKMIGIITGLITFFASGFTATVVYYEFVQNAFSQVIANAVIGLEFLIMAILTMLIFRKLVMIEKLNLEGRDDN